MKQPELFDYIAGKYEALFLRQLELESDRECAIPHVAAPRRERFSVAGAIFPTGAAWPRYHY